MNPQRTSLDVTILDILGQPTRTIKTIILDGLTGSQKTGFFPSLKSISGIAKIMKSMFDSHDVLLWLMFEIAMGEIPPFLSYYFESLVNQKCHVSSFCGRQGIRENSGYTVTNRIEQIGQIIGQIHSVQCFVQVFFVLVGFRILRIYCNFCHFFVPSFG